MPAPHSKKTLFKHECDNCDLKVHSRTEHYTYIDLSIAEEPYRVVVRTQVCLKCGPLLVFEVPEQLAHVLEEALTLAGYVLEDETIEIKKV